MKTKIILMLITFSFSSFSFSQLIFNPRTGDMEMDGILKEIDKNAKNNLGVFTKDVVTKFNIAQSSIDRVIKIMPPGDIFMAAQLAFLLGKPFDLVIKTYNVHKSKGWGAMAKEMGIKPGSPEFHNMKKALKTNGNSKSKIGNGKSGGPDKTSDHGNSNKNSNGKGKKK